MPTITWSASLALERGRACGRAPAHDLLDDLIRPQQQGPGDGKAERVRSLEVDHQLELRGLLDGQIPRLGALQDLVDVGGGTVEQVWKIWAIRHQAAGIHPHP